jgi:hypothetical protein
MRSTPPSQTRTPVGGSPLSVIGYRQGGRRIIDFVLPTPDEHFYNNSLFATIMAQNQLAGLQAVSRSAI